MARDLTQDCSTVEKRHLHSVVIDGAYRVGHIIDDELFRDWHNGHMYELTAGEWKTARPYPSAPIPDPD